MLHVEDLTYRYPGSDKPAARELSFAIEGGEIFGLLGPSGAGKSTTQGILVGLLKGWSGRVEVMDRELSSWGPEYYEHVGVSFEIPNHFLKLTARENLDYFRALYRSATISAAEALELVDLADAIDVPVAEFSKGMKNRLTFARSLLHSPKLWFLDEPTAGLDPVNARRVRDIVRQRQEQGATVFLTTHNMAVADELCDRVGFVVDGALERIDAPDALKRQYGRQVVRVSYEDGETIAEQEFPLDGLGDDDAFLALLREHTVRSIHTQETSLEEVFIQVTGRALS
jgi:fluoroquinolone transport system ATP-binding protein